MKTANPQKTNMKGQKLDVNAEVEFIFAAPKLKKERDQAVITDRFGLTGAKPKTLEEIGKALGITRERVRQIEKNTLKKLSDFVATDLRGQEISSVILGAIKSEGGVVRATTLDNDILGENASAKAKHQLSFIVACSTDISLYTESNHAHRSYFMAPLASPVIDKVLKEAVSILKSEDKPVEEKALVAKIRKAVSDLEPKTIVAIIAISKVILRTESGHLGLSHWRDINPKSIKDKTYYILKKHNKPLHYTDIADHIQNFGGKEKHVTKQAVHNELIRDERFVLIGRGIYALSEWGYASGVVEEVIETVLIEAGRPMHKDDIIDEVLKRRMVKETTILLNLQKKRFKRVARATYTVSNGRE